MLKQRLFSLKTILVLMPIVIGGSYFFIDNSQPFHTIDHNTIPVLQENPGWEKDLKLFKYRESTGGPENLPLYYRKMDRQRRALLRTDRQLDHVKELGPANIGGRSRAYLIDADDKNHHFAGSVSGGLWESWDAGKTWHPQSDHDENMSIAYLAQNPFDHDIIYYSTGEVAGNSQGVVGVGVFKSEDRGKNFRLLPGSEINGLFSTWRIVCSPNDKNTIYIASRKGAYVSRDAGDSFEKFYFSECTDIEVTDDGTIFLAVLRSGIYRGHEDNLKDWERLNLPSLGGAYSRIEIAIAPSKQTTMYAAFAKNNPNYGLLAIARSKDGGDSWRRMADPQVYTAQSWYNLVLQVHPTKPNIVVFGNVSMAMSTLSALNWIEVQGSHSDRHLAYFDPHDPNHLIITSDGGIDEYHFNKNKLIFDGSHSQTFNVTQYYAGDYFPETNQVIAGAQDNGTTAGGEDDMNFEKVYGADGTYTAVAKDDPTKVLIGTQNGKVYLSRNFKFKNRRSFYSIVAYFEKGRGGNDYFIAPFYLNAHNSEELLLMKTSSFWYTANLGQTWIAVDSNIYNPYKAEFLRDDSGLHIFVGGGRNLLSRYEMAKDGKSFGHPDDLSANAPSSLNEAFLRGMAIEPTDSQSLIVCYSTVSEQPRIWLVDHIFDGKNATWTNISGDMPPYLPVNDIAVSVINPKEIAAATDYGVYTTMDGGKHWQRDASIPNVAVFQVKIRPNDNKLFAFTHGRGAWMADFPVFPIASRDVQKAENTWGIYPNPVSDILRFKHSDKLTKVQSLFRYEIVDQRGRIVQSGVQMDIAEGINVSSLKPGVHVLITYNKKGSHYSNRFVKIP